MRVGFEPKATAWKKRGRPPRLVPEAIQELAERTYKTGNIGRVVVEPGEEKQAIELIGHLKRHAKNRGLHLQSQRDGRILRWQMIDKPVRKGTP